MADTRLLIGCVKNSQLCLIDLATHQSLFEGSYHKGDLKSVFYSHDGHFILYGRGDWTQGFIGLAEADTGKTIRTFAGHHATVECVRFSQDDCYILSAGTDGLAILWDRQTGREIQWFDIGGYAIYAAEFLNDPRYIAVACGVNVTQMGISRDALKTPRTQYQSDGTKTKAARPALPENAFYIHICDTRAEKSVHQFRGHRMAMRSLAVSPNGQYLLSGSEDKTARLWTIPENR